MSQIGHLPIRNSFGAIASLFILAGCGGGGGDTSSTGATPPVLGPQPGNPHSGSLDAPETTLTTQPAAVSNSNLAIFGVTSSTKGSSFEASLDGAAFSPVTPPVAVTNLSEGPHTFAIRARDPSGIADESPARFSWVVDTQGPTAAIVFPPPVSYTDATTLTVRGTSTDGNGVATVSVNGVFAQSADGFLTWSAQVPISTGTNQLVVTTKDSLGNTKANSTSASITNRGPVLAQMGGVIYDETSQRLIVADRSAGEIYAYDSNGNGTVLLARDEQLVASNPYHGLVVDAANSHHALVLSLVRLNILDLDSNQIVGGTSCSNDMTIGMSAAESVASDGHGNAFLVTSETIPTVAQVNLSSGLCTVIASGTVGSGTTLSKGSAIEYDEVSDAAHPRLLVGTLGSGNIESIDLGTGVRSLLAEPNPGNHSSTADMKLDAVHQRVLVLDPTQGAVVAVDLHTGNRSVLAAAAVGSGPALSTSHGLALNAAGTIFAGQDPGEILRIDASSGDRQVLVHSQVGAGQRMKSSYGLAIEQATGTPTSLLVTDVNKLWRIDLATGDRQIVSSSSVGSGVYTGPIVNFTLDTRTGHGGHAIGIMRGTDNSLVSIDLSNGNRQLIGDLSLPSANHVVNEVRVDPIQNRAILVDIDLSGAHNDAIYAVDLTTGMRTTISDQSHGSGAALNFPGHLILEPASNPTRAIVANGNNHNLLSIDLASGVRTVFSQGTAPQFLVGPVALDTTNGRLIGDDDYGYNLFSADLSAPTPQVLSGLDTTSHATVGHGSMFLSASGLAISAAANVIYATQSSASSVVAVDLTTGDRVVVSH